MYENQMILKNGKIKIKEMQVNKKYICK